MKRITIILFTLPLLLLSCNNEENSTSLKPQDIYSIKLSEIAGTPLSNPVTIKITNSVGEEIRSFEELQSNTQYNIIVKGAGADFYRIKSSDGFKVLKNPSTEKSASEDFVFAIKTEQELSGQLYVNIVPLHIDGKNFLRERPQVFLLPE